MYLFKVKLGGREELCKAVAGSVSIGFLTCLSVCSTGVLLEVSFLEFSGDTAGSVCSFSTVAKLQQAKSKLLLMLSGASSLSNFKDSKGGD